MLSPPVKGMTRKHAIHYIIPFDLAVKLIMTRSHGNLKGVGLTIHSREGDSVEYVGNHDQLVSRVNELHSKGERKIRFNVNHPRKGRLVATFNL
jgi:hypothetical protein